MYKYKLYCQTESNWKEVIASANPTVCPSDPAHTIDSSSISIIEKDILYNDGTPTELTLGDYKQLRYNEIDLKTMQLIGAGFTYDSHVFSLSLPAQTNWNTLKAQEADFTWPVEITTLDNNAYSLAQANLSSFWTAGRDAVKGHIDSGRVLKKSVFDAVDEAGVDAVIDNR